ncbi:MAG: hypothetical protein RIS94_1646 [Pseudomonadota bacterium]|jgi:uncharacterized membrane-anchored protein
MRNEHEQRRAMVAEMHLRRWPAIAAPACILQFVRLVADDDRDGECRLVRAAAGCAGEAQAATARHLDGTISPGLRFTWERHSEASTLTLFLEPADGAPGQLAMALDLADRLPGKVIRATRLVLVTDAAQAERALPGLGFSADDLVSCEIAADQGTDEPRPRIWSDFRLRDDGFGVVLVASNGMAPAALSRTLQRLQELGNYRNLALLGLPVAREGWRELDRIETRLNAINADLTRPEMTDDDLLQQVSDLWTELIAQISASNYRISATEAYAAIVEERLADLHIQSCGGHMSLADFTQRRFLPAVRTCTAHRRRSQYLAQRASQVVALLRTRIETRIENQNGRLLASMEESASRQLRLQQLVEGLSVVAVSYYALGLAGKMLDGIVTLAPALNSHVMSALATPLVIGATWAAIRRQKRRILGPGPH